MSEPTESAELLKFLESGSIEVVGKIKQVIHENLYSSKDASFLNSLVDSYVHSKSENLLAIITGVNESQCQYLFEKMNDLLKQKMQSDVSSLFVSIIRQQPSWLYKIVGSHFFANYLKSLRGEQDVIFLMSGAVIISMLLPCIPSLVAPYLGDILEIFIQMATYLVNKPAFLPDILTLHLQIGVYILYHRLYAMYPNNFLSYVKSCFGSKSNDPVFCNVIQPMSQFVKFHPGLILDTLKSETDNTKWKTFQPHDIFAECQKISLDPLDAIKEATYTVFSHQPSNTSGVTPKRELVVSATVTSVDAERQIESNLNYKLFSNERNQPNDEQGRNDRMYRTDPASYLSSHELSVLWSPSFLCGLSTPPSSRTMSPANSAQDILSLSEFVQRPMTPVADPEKDSNYDNQDTRTSTPGTDRRKSSGDFKKASQKSHKSPQLFGKSKSEEFVDLKTKKSQPDVAKAEIVHEGTKHGVNKTKGSPKKKKDKPLHGDLVKLSPKLSRSDHAHSIKQTHSAPSTPAITSKDKFGFNLQDLLSEQQVSVESQGKSTALTATPQNHENKRQTAAFQSNVSQNAPDSPTYEHSANVSLLRVIKDLHQEALSKLNIQSSHNQDLNEHLDGGGKSKARSPMELLDEFIECGSNLHSLQLSKIPITSQFDTDWTYYGGTTPADELSILKTQVSLFEVQLQYERYKCDQHVLRNRRLVGKVHKAQAFEDELNGLRSQISSLKSELSEAKITLKHKDELNRRLQDFCRASEKQQIGALEQDSVEIEKLRSRVEELRDSQATKEQELAKIVEELKSVQHELFEKTSELDHIKRRLEHNDAIKAKADNLTKALVTYQDKYDRIKRQFQSFETNYVGGEESLIEIESLKNEIRGYKTEREDLATSLDAAKVRIADLESLLAKKEISIRDMKSSVEQVHQKHGEEIKILEERYKCLKKATQGMESYILYLFAKMEEGGRDLRAHGHAGGRRRTGRHDGHGNSADNRRHGDEGIREESRRSHIKGHSNVTDSVHGGVEDALKDIDDRGVNIIPKRDTEKGHRTCRSCEKQSPSMLHQGHKPLPTDYSASGGGTGVTNWTRGETGMRGNDDDNEKHVNDSGIESSGIL